MILIATYLSFLLVGLESEESAVSASGLTKLPVLRHYVEAPYPPAAFREGREGSVTLAIDVDVEGGVERVEVLNSAGREFDLAALDAACGFEFEPAEAGALGKVPVRITYRYGFVFKAPGFATTRTTSTSTASDDSPTRTAQANTFVNFSGRIKESGNRKTIFFGEIIISTGTVTLTSTETDTLGHFAFRDIPPGKYNISVRAPLFEPFHFEEMIQKSEAIEVLYYLTRDLKNPYEVVVKASLQKREVSRRTLKFEEIERLPGTQGDAIRVVQNLPGVARSPYGIGLLVVRGAPPQDTGVFLDGHRMPILFHFGGIGGVTSVVNSRILEAIDFYPGGFGPEQGRVSAGAVELRSRFAETDRVHGEATLDLAGASVFVEGPVTKSPEDGAFVFALRRSYIDGIFAGITSLTDSSVSIAPRYYDYQARYDRPLGSQSKMFTLFLYGVDDELIFLTNDIAETNGGPQGTRSRTYFHRINPRFTYKPDEDTMFTVSPIFGVDYSNTQSTGDAPGNTLRLLIRNVNTGVRVDGLTRISDFARIRAGGDILYYRFSSDSELPAFSSVKDFPGPISTDVPTRKDTAIIPAILASMYSELELSFFDRLTLFPGLRLDIYNFHAQPAPLLDTRLIDGRTILGLDPRISSRYRFSDDFALKGQAGIYRQPPLPPQIFLNADLPLQVVNQYSFGFEWLLMDSLSLDLTGYYRNGSKIPRGTSRTEVVDGKIRAVGLVPEGESRSYGAEVLLKLEKRAGFFGWISYTLSRSETRRTEDNDFVPNFVFDQTHNLNILLSYELGLNWFLSARFRFVTGGGLPQTTDRWFDAADRDAYSRDTGGQRRAPAFHQLDVRIDKRWIFDEWSLEAYLDVQNIYNAKNTEFYAPSFDFKTEVAIPSLPIFPILGVKGVF